MRWKIWYSNGKTFSNQDGLPQSLEREYHFGVQVITQEDKDHNWATQTGGDFYVWDDRGDGWRWWGVDIWGLVDYVTKPGYKIILLGESVPSDTFGKIFQAAKNDPEFGKKVAFRIKERRPDELA